MAFSSVFPFLLPTHSVDCAVHLLLSHSRALLVSSALFHPFTALKCPFDGPFTALKCPFDGPFTALKCPFQMAPCPSENLGRTLGSGTIDVLKCPYHVAVLYRRVGWPICEDLRTTVASTPPLQHQSLMIKQKQVYQNIT